jgi:cysteine desulfurase / selenocysteine lyase
MPVTDEAKAIELRKLFPVVDHWTYLYNGSIHPCAQPVADAMAAFLRQWQEGGETAFFPGHEAFGRLREKFAALIHVDAKNIVITESTTAALTLAAQLLRPHAGQNLVVTDLAFMSSTYNWLVGQIAGCEMRFVKSHEGQIRMDDLAAAVDENTAAVSICAVTVGSGFRFNLHDVHAIVAPRGTPLIVDGAQAVGVVDVHASDPPLDFLACTASKWLMGPAGVGFLYVADKYLDAAPPGAGWYAAANIADWDVRHCELYPDARRFQGGIPNLIGVVGALAGLELLEQIGRDFIERRVRELTTHAIEGLDKLGVDLWTPRADHQRAGIVFLRPPEAASLHAKLKAAHIYCGHFLGGIRIDPTFYNTHEEIDRFLAVVRSHLAV